MRKRAFSMIELMIVIAIVAIISAITLGTFRSVANGNRKTSCQSNMAQIYGAARLYAQDYNGKYPLLNGTLDSIKVGSRTMSPGEGIGLWALYAYGTAKSPLNEPFSDFPISADANLTGYIKSTKAFHCPNDDYTYDDTDLNISGLNTTQLQYQDGLYSYYNPSYLSYQSPPVPNGVSPKHLKVDDLTGTPVYSSFRRDLASTMPNDINNNKRQLVTYKYDGTDYNPDFDSRPDDTTVVLWCRFHRKLNKDGTVVSTSDTNDYDNVLFSDGSVQWLQAKQLVSNTAGTQKTCIRGWDRVPTQIQYTLNPAPDTLCTG